MPHVPEADAAHSWRRRKARCAAQRFHAACVLAPPLPHRSRATLRTRTRAGGASPPAWQAGLEAPLLEATLKTMGVVERCAVSLPSPFYIPPTPPPELQGSAYGWDVITEEQGVKARDHAARCAIPPQALRVRNNEHAPRCSL